MKAFAHLRVHSNYSFCFGASPVTELVDRAAALGMKHLALTDTNGLYGAVRFYQEARKRGLNPIIGAVVDDGGPDSRSAVILAADRSGFSSLCRMVTRRHLDTGFDLARSIGDLGPGCRVLIDNDDLLRSLADGPAREILYGEINPRSLMDGEDRACRMLTATRQLGLPLAATADACFAAPSGYSLHLVLRAIGSRKTVQALTAAETALPQQYLASTDEMSELFRHFPEAVDEARKLAEVCRLELDIGRWKYPRFILPDGESPFSRLWKIGAAGLSKRYRPVTPEAAKRFVHEMEVIDSGGFAPYFLLVHDILRQARKWNLRHVGRGSAANSIVSYCLGFTAVDPLSHNLYFERFLNPARKSPPDIDLDFSWKERKRVLDYVYRRYGEDRVAMISTHVTFGPRAAAREVAGVMGLGPGEIAPITRRIPHWGVSSLKELKRSVPECRGLPLDEEPWAGIMATAEKLLGFPRHLSVHPGGIIVAPDSLDHWCPLETAPSGLVVTQYDMFGVEDIGLIKIDLLSQRSLGVLEDVLADLAASGRTIPIDDFDLVSSDEKTRSLMRNGKTMGCFYVESPAMRSLLKKLQTDSFGGLTAASSVIRPGVAQSGMMAAYIDRQRHPRKRSLVHPLLKEVLSETHGVMIYQEDVIRVAHLVAGLTLSEADLLRRSMSGKMRSRKAMGSLRNRFLQAAGQNGVPPSLARELWRQISSFAGYAFCKAHSASYAVLSFQLAYLKAHYPANFMAAVISNGGGYYTAAAYIQEARRLGLRILPPDVNSSLYRYTAEERGVRVGLMAVRELSRRGSDSILRARRLGSLFLSLHDLVRKTELSRKEVEILIRCGACDGFGMSRPCMLWHLASIDFGAERDTENSLLAGGGRAPVPALRDYSLCERCAAEMSILGFTAAVHPLALFRESIPQSVVTADAMGRCCGRRVSMAGWPIAYKRVRTTKGEVMKFLSLEDLTGTFEAVLFPDVYRRFADLTVSSGPFIIEGKITEENGVFTLVADRLEKVRPAAPPWSVPLESRPAEAVQDK